MIFAPGVTPFGFQIIYKLNGNIHLNLNRFQYSRTWKLYFNNNGITISQPCYIRILWSWQLPQHFRYDLSLAGKRQISTCTDVYHFVHNVIAFATYFVEQPLSCWSS